MGNQTNEQFRSAQERVFISPLFRGALTQSDLLSPAGTFHFRMRTDAIHRLDAVLFELVGEHFRFAFTIRSARICLQRCDDEVAVHPCLAHGPQRQTIIARWDPAFLDIRCGLGRQVENVKAAATSPAFPPLSLIRHARKLKYLPSEVYASGEALRNVVYQALADLEIEVARLGAINAFWDQSYAGLKKGTPTPKREPDIHPTLRWILSDWALLRSIDVIPENVTAVGNVDFCFVGSVRGTGSTPICVEVKQAHADDLLHGLTVQLPAYMLSRQALYGAYIVLWFRGDWFDKPTVGQIQRIWKTTIQNLELFEANGYWNLDFALKQRLLATPRLGNIRTFLIDVSKAAPASKA